ncbi:MAG: fused MFS/spermidine synthase [Legionellales bacterium]|nr:fused MFS/spermidine synthase [Legionellales bacterium]
MRKTILGHCIYETSQGTKVLQNPLYRWLTLGSPAIQTLINRRHPERAEMKYLHHLSLSVRANPADCLLLGLGGAGIAHALKPFLSQLTLHAVEESSEIIDIAQSYFMSNTLPHLSIIHEDALTYVLQCKRQYQHVMVDLFDAHTLPKQCMTHEFFEHCTKILKPQGIIAVNLANRHEQMPVLLQLREHFKQSIVSMPVKGSANMVIIASKDPSVNGLLDLLRRDNLKTLYWDPLWGCIAEILHI